MSGPRLEPRITARKTPAIEALIYRTLVRPALRRAFHRIALHCAEPWAARGPAADLATIVYANHPSWWDGYIAFFLSDELWRCESYLMMEEPQLARYGFFRYCGVFSVDRHDPREGMRSVRYAAELLRTRPGRVLWIFPQGEITPNDRRPFETFGGVAHIVKRAAPVRCIPMALRFEFLDQQRPEALIRLGPAQVIDGGIDTAALHQQLDQHLLHEMDALRADVLSGATAHYRTVLRGRSSINVAWDRVRATVGLR